MAYRVVPAILNLWFKIPEKLRFLLVGGWNTLFSLVLFALIFATSENYKLSLVIAHFTSVLQSFLTFRFFVFRANLNKDANILMEYLKINLVYLIYFGLNYALLVLFVETFKINPIIAQVLITCILVVYAYIANKYFTFKNGKRK